MSESEFAKDEIWEFVFADECAAAVRRKLAAAGGKSRVSMMIAVVSQQPCWASSLSVCWTAAGWNGLMPATAATAIRRGLNVTIRWLAGETIVLRPAATGLAGPGAT